MSRHPFWRTPLMIYLPTVTVQDDAITKAVGECHAIVTPWRKWLSGQFVLAGGRPVQLALSRERCVLFGENVTTSKRTSHCWRVCHGVLLLATLPAFPALTHSDVLTAFSEVVRQCAGPLSLALSLCHLVQRSLGSYVETLVSPSKGEEMTT